MRAALKPARLAVAVALLAPLACASPASALSPWWHFSTATRPTVLQPGSARDAVQELTVRATGGSFQLVRGKERPTGSVELPFNASHQALQSALEGIYGSGNVGVTGGPGNSAGSLPYTITFIGSLADQPIEAIVEGQGTELTGAGAGVSIVRTSPGSADGQIVLLAENVGDGTLDATSSPVQIVDSLPPGLTAVGIAASEPEPEANAGRIPFPCSLVSLTCTFTHTLAPYDELEVRIDVLDSGGPLAEANHATVSGGQAPSASSGWPISSGGLAPFGAESYGMSPEEDGGSPVTQAGSHPFQLTTTVGLNQDAATTALAATHLEVEPVRLAKDVRVKLPPGLVGNPTVLPVCPMTQFLTFEEAGELGGDECPPDTAVGVASVLVNEPFIVGGTIALTQPVFALEPGFGEPARFGFYVTAIKTPVFLDTALRGGPGEDYGVTVSAANIPEAAGFLSSTLTFWGTPGDPRHDNSRGWGCLQTTRGGKGLPCTALGARQPQPFLTLPTSCSGPLQSSVALDSWLQPDAPVSAVPTEPMPALDGCGRLSFSPIFRAAPSTQSASSPSGLDVNLDFHDEGLTAGEGTAQAQLKDTTVTLPEGFTINPSAGVGLSGCTPGDYANETLTSPPGAGCPNSSKLGTVEIHTPLLSTPVQGSLFIAQPHDNPFDSLVALYIVAKNPETGILIKLAGKVTPNPVTGQLVTTFENNPQLPFDHFNFHFREGQQAPLITPATCGTYTTRAQLTPWSDPANSLTDTSSFTISSGAGGGACPSGGQPRFAPQIQAGALNNNAGSFSPFYLRLTRTDADSEISTFSTNMPQGFTGILSGIPFCPEADIALARTSSGVQEEAEPSCPAASQLGRTLVGTGAGAVLAYTPGKIYLAGPYNGDPFSLVSVTSAVVGPFDLGTVVVRFGLRIDPTTAQVSVDPSASEPIPHIIQGIVTHVRDIRVYIDRPHFTLNPTSCNPMAISSTLGSNVGQSATISSPFQAANCAALKFSPKFTVSTSAKTSKAQGASLTAKLEEPSGAIGTQANIAKVKVELPLQLPSQLKTLQKACIDRMFNANPATCPPESIVGHATVRTPLLPVPLSGPAYFVSHGGEEFPSLTIVLQGDGVKVELVGSTFISKKGITSSTFKTVPDVPFQTFELTLPQGKYAALAAHLPDSAKGSFCGQSLRMPTEMTAHNGVTIHRSTPITVTGCPSAISVISSRVDKRTLTMSVYVPAAGKLTASGTGVARTSKSSAGQQILTLALDQKKAGRRRAKIKLVFSPKHGRRQTKTLKATFRR
jgi:hypothetical protein